MSDAVDIEKPACFFLGREYDPKSQKCLEKPIMYDAKDLCTHGVVVGMTGSGKTGLAISLLEEAAIDSIPCIIIDPKGDLANIMLQFDDLDPKEFAKWVSDDDASVKGLTKDAYAAQLAERYRKGLAETFQTPERIKRLKESGEWRVYTPGSEAGLPLSVLRTFAAPKTKVLREELNQRIDSTAAAVLGLTGISADPVQSKEHILIAQILLDAWTKKEDVDLTEIIKRIQEPPMEKIGAFDVDTFYPKKERLKLAVALNNILAAPSFSTWIDGEPLDIAGLLAGGKKTRHLIFSVAHLEDAQRMFFISLLLEEVLNWTRKQTGTSSLRAVLYFDEVFGYLPPHPHNPPSKIPLMTLLKQARAFGVGVLLATQNPIDLDYKALSNAGTWMVGKLQTERDKARLIEGLCGVAAEKGTLANKEYLEGVISALGDRVFLLHDIHRGGPVLFQSRFALSFLRGPMTRDEIKELMDPFREAATPPKPEDAKPTVEESDAPPTEDAATPQATDQQFRKDLAKKAATVPAVDAADEPDAHEELPTVFLPIPNPVRPAGDVALLYQPRLLGIAEVGFLNRKRGVDHRQRYCYLMEVPDDKSPTNWASAERIAEQFASQAEASARYASVPGQVNAPRKLKSYQNPFADYLYSSAKLLLHANETLELVGKPGEDLLAFQQRCETAAKVEADKAIDLEKVRYGPRFQDAGLGVPTEHIETSSVGTAFRTAKKILWWMGSQVKELKGIAQDQAKADALWDEWRAKVAAQYDKWHKIAEDISEITITPTRQSVQVVKLAVAWVPYWEVKSATGVEHYPAYK